MRDVFRIAALAGGVLACTLAPDMGAAQTPLEIVPIGPRQSSLDPTDPDGASGGRVNGLAIAPTGNAVMYGASEWGGLFKSTDTGRSWQHLPSHTPVATWDVEVDPANASRVYATSFYDGRVTSRAGINVSTDAGATWTKPVTAMPPAGFCADPARREEPSAFGIAINPAAPQNVYVGTNCGLALSHDSGASWSFVDPSPADPADDVWDVVVHHGGIIDLCGDDGHARSTDGVTWTTATGANPLPGGLCSIAASPDEAHVLFAVVGLSIFESDDGGASWPVQYANPSPQGRIPFVEINQRSGPQFDFWFGDVSLHRRTCTTPTPAVSGGSGRCQPSASWVGDFTRDAGGHDDTSGILFDQQVAQDACPLVYASDGGVYFNTVTASPACHTPVWEQPNATPQALWQWNMASVARPGLLDEEIYFGNQDDGTFGTTGAGQVSPNWNNEQCCDSFDMVAEPGRVLSTLCCFGGGGRATRLFISSPGLTGATEINTYPAGNLSSFQQLASIVNFAASSYALITSSGVFVTTNIGANPIVWTRIGAGTTPPGACGIQASRSGGTTTLFVKSGGCDGDSGGNLWQHAGTSAGGTWQQVTRSGGGSFGVYAVDPGNPARIVASDLAGATPQMVMTTDGGATWTVLTQLDTLMTGGGAFRYRTTRGPTRFTGIGSYPQPTLVAFDPTNTSTLVAAGADSGVFLSRDGGTSWQLLTDPINPGGSGTPHIPRARYAHFEHGPDRLRVYLGTQGRGVWRITLPTSVPVATAPPVVTSASAAPTEPADRIEIVLGPAVVRVGTDVDIAALRRVLEVVQGLP